MEATNKTRRAFGYVRVSSAGQGGEERDGIPRQKAAIRRHADAHNIRIVKWFAYTVSGKKELENRPAPQELMTALHGNGTMLVLIEKLSYQETWAAEHSEIPSGSTRPTFVDWGTPPQ